MLEPVGPLPARVYWRRRVLAAVACALAVVLLVWIISGLVGGADEHPVRSAADASRLAGAPSSPPSTSPPVVSPTTSPTTVPPRPAEPVRRCPDPVIEVVAKPAAPSYRVGEHPLLRLAVVNRGTVPCTRDVSRKLRELVITTGDGRKRLWSSNDCFHPAAADRRTLAPGQPLLFSLTWAGRTSAPGCPAQRAAVATGKYRVTGKLGTITGPATRLTLTR